MSTHPDNATIVPIFATPFAAVDTGAGHDFNARVVALCEARRAAALAGDHPGDPLHFRGGDDLFGLAAAAGLERLVLGHAAALVARLGSGGTEPGKLQLQARAWPSIVEPGGNVPSQHFPEASWLAIYCAQAGERDAGHAGAGVLRLYERRLASVYRDASIANLAAPYRYGNHTWSPVPGWLVLFPAHLPHEVSVVRSATPLVLVFAKMRFVLADFPGEHPGGEGG